MEYTQEFYGTQSERICPEQIGFLGICGNKYPVIKGPNKIGRDPLTCSIVLTFNTVSGQHAVINIINKNDYIVMDLDSVNKTKLSGKTLKPYIPHPIHDGDTVEFGEIFGIFKLLEEDDDLPKVPTKYVSRVSAATTVPESPDVSVRDDAFIVPSQPKTPKLRRTKPQQYVKLGKTKSIQPTVSNKIDNAKKFTSFSLDDSDILNDSVPSVLKEKENIDTNDIHELPSIHNLDTQLPGVLPDLCKINKQLDLSAYDDDTEEYIFEKDSPESKKSNKLNTSEEEVLFDEVNNGLVEDLESQAIRTDHIDLPIYKLHDDSDFQSQIVKPKCTKRSMRILSSDSSDCEYIDLLPTEVIPSKKVDDEDTDCEVAAESKLPQTKINKPSIIYDDQATQDLDVQYYDAPPKTREVDSGEEDVIKLVSKLTIQNIKETDTDHGVKKSTPLVHGRRKKKSISSAVLEVTKKSVVSGQNLPTGVLTRSMTAKILEAQSSTSICRNGTKRDQLLETVQKKPSSKKSENNEEKVEKSEDTKTINDKKRKTKEPNNNTKERASKNSDVSADNKMQLHSTVESHNLTRSSVRSIVSWTENTRKTYVSLRPTPARMARTQYVLFITFPVDDVENILKTFGAVVVNDVMKCTVLLTSEIKITFELLCAVGLGKPIVGPNWVQDCVDKNMIVDPRQYILRDEVAENMFQFSLEATLVGPRNVLQGYNVSNTPGVLLDQSELKLIVECSGGKWQEGGPNWLCITCHADQHMWPALHKLGATLINKELILRSVLRQELYNDGTKVHFL